MRVITRFSCLLLAAAVPLACSTTDPARMAPQGQGPAAADFPVKIDAFGYPVAIGPGQRGANTPRGPAADGEVYLADGPFVVDPANLPVVQRPDWVTTLTGPDNKRSHAPGPIPEEHMAELRERARNLPDNPRIPQQQQATIGDVAAGAPASLNGFAALDAGDCCGGSSVSVPPDPEMAAGLNHVIVAVNSAYAVFDKSGALVAGPHTLEDLFNLADCGGTFDPNVLYDAAADRYFLGAVGNGQGTHYCMAVSQSGNPLGQWNVYTAKVDINGNFFDYPHAGVGRDAIYAGANMFGASFEEGRIWAFEKQAMYAGDSARAVSHSVGVDFTPQPMNLHATNPAAGPHYFIANDVKDNLTWNGDDFVAWQWSNPFTGGTPALVGLLDLMAETGLEGGFPVDQPQRGGRRAAVLDGGDWRVQDAEAGPDGSILITQAIGCNPGGGTVNCVRWAEVVIDAETNVFDLLDWGLIASSGEYRSYPDGAINACGDLAVGYTKTSSSSYPGIWVAAAREADVTGPEVEAKPGETTYTSFQNWRQANRWGDYTGMTIDPDGETFWYLGEYAADNGLSTNWATWVSSFKLDSCSTGGPGPVDNLPDAVDDVFSLDLATAGSTSGNVLSNDDQGDGPASVAFGAPSRGSLSETNNPPGQFTYTPDAGFTSGTDSFGYQITDADGDTASATVTINVSDSGGGGDGLTITSVVGTKSKGIKIVDLAWSGTDRQGLVTITRNGSVVQETTTEDDGSFQDITGEKGGGTYVYEICEQNTSNCDSAEITF